MKFKTFNMSKFVLKKIVDNPGRYTLSDVSAMVERPRNSFKHLLDRGDIEYTGKIQFVKGRKGGPVYSVTVRATKQGKDRFAATAGGGAMPPGVA